MRPQNSVALAILLALSAPAARSAFAGDDGSLFETYFAKAQEGAACYGRTYDDAHLTAHAAQTVQRIEIDMTKANADARPNTAERFELGFALAVKTSPEWYGQEIGRAHV